MPLIIVSPESSSVATRKDGSSAIILLSATPIFSVPALSFGAIAIEITGSGNTIGSSVAGSVGIGQRVTRLRVLHAQQGDDVAGLRGVQLFTRVGVHFDDAADAFGLTGERVEHVVALAEACPNRCA